MIKCLFVSPVDGWAIVEDKDDTFLIYPPYRSEQKKRIEKTAIKSTIETGGFIPSEEVFTDYQATVDYLDRLVGDYRSEVAPIESSKTLALRALQYADARHINNLLERIEVDILETADFNLAEGIILEILEVPLSKKDNQIFERCIGLLKKCTALREKRAHVHIKAIDVPSRFPHCTKRYGVEDLVAIGAVYSKRRSMFAF
ncbi:hypothetical protein [Neorhizobium sp. T25_27]|uniref:hypothetical protein n=1 Tax=Neorhizobium sp. T25_27 TaxID=2093831 RepID=UPI000CF878AB|nr:hypothetical protein [Neorhizobium sp. T25_27]